MSRTRRGVETYTLGYTFKVDGIVYVGRDDVPEDFYKEYSSLNRDITIRYQRANPKNSEIFEEGLSERHNDIDWLHGGFIVGSGFMGLLWLREGAVGLFPWIRGRLLAMKGKLTPPSLPVVSRKGARQEIEDLRELKKLLDDGCITKSEFESKKQELLGRV